MAHTRDEPYMLAAHILSDVLGFQNERKYIASNTRPCCKAARVHTVYEAPRPRLARGACQEASRANLGNEIGDDGSDDEGQNSHFQIHVEDYEREVAAKSAGLVCGRCSAYDGKRPC